MKLNFQPCTKTFCHMTLVVKDHMTFNEKGAVYYFDPASKTNLFQYESNRIRSQYFCSFLKRHFQYKLTVWEIKTLWRLCCPQSHGVAGIVSIAWNGLIIWHSKNCACINPAMAFSTNIWLHSSIKLNRNHVLWSGFLPGVPKLKPVIGQLNLEESWVSQTE